MSNYIESKFRVDYQDFDMVPTQHIQNLNLVNSRIHQIEHIHKLEKEIAELELSLAAETKMVADDVLRQNVFPRFNGYSDFLGHEFVSQETIDNYPSFGNLATAVESSCGDFRDENKLHTMFEFMLENFIWIFFEGCGAWMVDNIKHVVVDYDHRSYMHGSDAYPSDFTYYFNATNTKNGKTYRVAFTFYDLKNAIDLQYMKNNYSDILSVGQRNLKPFESIRTVGCGQILCTISQVDKSKYEGDPVESDKVYLRSFDPLEISAFIKHVVYEGKGEIND